MRKLNQDFRHHRAFDIIALFVFIIFIALFAQSIITVIGAFETEVYSNTVADLSRMSN